MHFERENPLSKAPQRARATLWQMMLPTIFGGVLALAALANPGLLAAQTNQATRRESPDLRVMSFNLRYATANDGANRWERRREQLTRTIHDFAPDLLGTQETLELQKDWLDQNLPEFESCGVGRDDGAKQGEMTALWYRSERFERLDAGHFWLSETPDRPGSVSWDSALTRMASWVKLKDRNQPNGAPILFLNTHFDHRGEEARRRSAILIRQKLVQLGEGCDWIVTGDFNAAEDSPAHKELFSGANPALLDTYRVVFPKREAGEGTFNGFDPQATAGPRIDWVGVSSRWKVSEAQIIRTAVDGHTPSDHFPVTAILTR